MPICLFDVPFLWRFTEFVCVQNKENKLSWQTFVPYKLTSLSRILAVSSDVMVELKHVTIIRPIIIQVKQTRRPQGDFGILSP